MFPETPRPPFRTIVPVVVDVELIVFEITTKFVVALLITRLALAITKLPVIVSPAFNTLLLARANAEFA